MNHNFACILIFLGLIPSLKGQTVDVHIQFSCIAMMTRDSVICDSMLSECTVLGEKIVNSDCMSCCDSVFNYPKSNQLVLKSLCKGVYRLSIRHPKNKITVINGFTFIVNEKDIKQGTLNVAYPVAIKKTLTKDELDIVCFCIPNQKPDFPDGAKSFAIYTSQHFSKHSKWQLKMRRLRGKTDIVTFYLTLRADGTIIKHFISKSTPIFLIKELEKNLEDSPRWKGTRLYMRGIESVVKCSFDVPLKKKCEIEAFEYQYLK